VELVSVEQCRRAAPRLIGGDHSLARTGIRGKGKGCVNTRAKPLPLSLSMRAKTYFIGENAAGIRILFCWLTKNSRVLGGQFASFCDSARIFARSARSL
jgi:hypothetical protein